MDDRIATSIQSWRSLDFEIIFANPKPVPPQTLTEVHPIRRRALLRGAQAILWPSCPSLLQPAVSKPTAAMRNSPPARARLKAKPVSPKTAQLTP